MNIVLKNKRVLITGGTGSLGSKLVYKLIKDKSISEIRIFSRDEFKQSEMARNISDKRVTYWLGNVCDLDRLKEACSNINIIIHTAALKRMDTVSRNLFELVNVNILGTKNVMIAGEKCERVIVVSSDKAFKPENMYGASKMISEGIALAYPNAVVWRFGNFKWSRGSVWDIFWDQRHKNLPFTITDLNATRFVISIDTVCDYLLSDVGHGIHYPKNLESMTIKEIADSVDKNHPHVIVGLREGEKMHESFNSTYTSEK